MLFCGSFSFLKEQIVENILKIKEKEPLSHITFIVHTNKMRNYLRECILKHTDFIANIYFYTPIDISKKITGIEPLDDFEKEMIFRKFLYEREIFLDGLPEEFNLLTQQIKEHFIETKKLDKKWVKDVISDYENFKKENYLYDREDTHYEAIKNIRDFYTDYLFIVGIVSVVPLYRKLFEKLRDKSKKVFAFLPFLTDSGIYQSYFHFKEVLDFYKKLTGSNPFIERDTDGNLEVAKSILKPEKQNIKSRINIFSGKDIHEEVQNVASIIQSRDLPFHRVTVLIPDRKYLPYIKEIFTRYKIPFYSEEKERYLDNLYIKKFYSVFRIKDENFSRESILNILPFLEIKDFRNVEKSILSLPEIDSFSYLKKYIDGFDRNLKNLLETVNQIKDEDTFENYLENTEKLLSSFKDTEEKNSLRELLLKAKENFLYKNLFQKLSFRTYRDIFKSILTENIEDNREKGDFVSVLTVNSGIGNNSEYLFILGLNRKLFPKSLREESVSTSKSILNFDYPYYLLFHEIQSFVSLLDRGKEIYLSYAKKDKSEPLNPSFLIKEVQQVILEKEIEVKKLYPDLKSVAIEYPENTLAKEKLKKLYKKISKEYKKEDFIYEFVKLNFPISATSFQKYAICPYIYFWEEVIKIKDTEKEDRRKINPAQIGEVIHNLLRDIYKNNIGKVEEYINKIFKEQLSSKLEYLLPYYQPFEEEHLKRLKERVLDFIYKDRERLKNEGKEVFIELLEKEVKNEIFTGRIDRADKKGEKIFIYDYKTGKVRDVNQEILKKYIQLLIYAVLIGENVEEIGIISLQDKERKYIYSLKREEFQGYINHLNTIHGYLKNKIFAPVENESCFYCSFKDFCQKLKEEEVYGKN